VNIVFLFLFNFIVYRLAHLATVAVARAAFGEKESVHAPQDEEQRNYAYRNNYY